MFCSNCGKELPDNAAFCANCGTKLREENAAYINGHPSWTQQYNPVPNVLPQKPQPIMNWYKFLIYFFLYAGAAINFLCAVLYLTGGHFSIFGLDYIYNKYSGLRMLDIGQGIVLIALIPFAFIVRNALAKYKKDAPKMFCIYHVASETIPLIFLFFNAIVMHENTSDVISQFIGTIAGQTLFITLNVIYFNKRKHLFVN